MNIVKAEKYQNEAERQHYIDDAGQTPRFGFCWWSWYPKFYSYITETKVYGVMIFCYCVEI